VNETSWAHVWRLHFRYLGTGYDSYEVWIFHGEPGTRVVAGDQHDCNVGGIDRMDKMLEAL
jgi:hypothetical protein